MMIVSITVLASAGLFCCLWRRSLIGFLLGAYLFSLSATQLVFFLPAEERSSSQVCAIIIVLGSMPILFSGMALAVRVFYRQKNISTKEYQIQN